MKQSATASAITLLVEERFACLDSVEDLAELVESMREVARLEATEQEKRHNPLAIAQPDCTKGCSTCCYTLVETMPAEVVALVAWLEQTLATEDLDRLRRRVESADRTTRGLTERQRGGAGVACPMLVDDACSIYAERPLDCEAYQSSDVRACEAAIPNYDFDEIPVIQPRYNAYEWVRVRFGAEIERAGVDGQTVEFIAALQIALTTENLFDRWSAGERVFAPAHITSPPH